MSVVLLAACSDYQLDSKVDPELPPVDSTTTPTTPPVDTPPVDTPPVDTAPPEDTGPLPPVGCAAVTLPALSWVGIAPFATEPDPVDAGGLPFWDPAADRSAWVPVAIPDRGIPVGQDRAYHTAFTLTDLPYNLSLNLQSDDGIWVWVNGSFVGHWGGDWQQEGCVNENASCLVTTPVPAVDVTSFLVVGENTIAARVTNPVMNAYFEILPECVDGTDTGVGG